MAKWWELHFIGGPPTDADWEHVLGQVRARMTSGQLYNEEDHAGWVITETGAGPAEIFHDGQSFPYESLTINWGPHRKITGVWVNHGKVIGQVSITMPDGEQYSGELTAGDYTGMAGSLIEPGSG